MMKIIINYDREGLLIITKIMFSLWICDFIQQQISDVFVHFIYSYTD